VAVPYGWEVGLALVLLFLFVGLPVLCGVVVWGFFDAGDRPPEVWTTAGRSRRFWLRAQAAGIFVPPVVTIVYVLAVRPRLQRATPRPEAPPTDAPSPAAPSPGPTADPPSPGGG
jgi:hypothetical protein